MKLNLQKIKEITLGAVRIAQKENGFNFYRFTETQEELYKNRSEDFYNKTFSTSGIQLCFKTNSKNLFLKTFVTSGSSRQYFAFDIFVNGIKTDPLNNYSDVELPCDYTKISLPMGEFEKTFYLGTGEKEVRIYFPWSVKAIIQEISLDDGSFVEPVKPKNKLLCLGDSITHGYDALFPSNKYVSRLAMFLDAEEYNKAIGGEIFFPELVKEKEEFYPDYITVAYGTNDWNSCTQQDFTNNCNAFFTNLYANYPDSKIIVITPIWRKEHKDYRKFGEFENLHKIISNTVEKYENMQVVSGFDFIDHNEKFFADLRLHPNDNGFEQYFTSLVKWIKI